MSNINLFKAKRISDGKIVCGCLILKGYGHATYSAIFSKNGWHYRIDESTIEPCTRQEEQASLSDYDT